MQIAGTVRHIGRYRNKDTGKMKSGKTRRKERKSEVEEEKRNSNE